MQGLVPISSEFPGSRIKRDPKSLADLADYFDGSEKNPGWLEVEWSKPTGSELEKVIEHLKGLKQHFEMSQLEQNRCMESVFLQGKSQSSVSL